MKNVLFFTEDWIETTADKAFYACEITWDKDGKVKKSVLGVKEKAATTEETQVSKKEEP